MQEAVTEMRRDKLVLVFQSWRFPLATKPRLTTIECHPCAWTSLRTVAQRILRTLWFSVASKYAAALKGPGKASVCVALGGTVLKAVLKAAGCQDPPYLSHQLHVLGLGIESVSSRDLFLTL